MVLMKESTLQSRTRGFAGVPALFFIFCGIAVALLGGAEAGVTKVVKNGDGSYGLTHDGAAYFLKGGGVDSSLSTSAYLQAIKDAGGNSVRTWGAASDPQTYDRAQALGLTVCAGLWISKPGEISYANAAQVKEQHDRLLAYVNTYKNHPAIAIWSIGNEYEGGADANVWNAVQQLAASIKAADPNHPTSTVWAMITKSKMDAVKTYCPSLDTIGINAYGGDMDALASTIVGAGLDRPYMVTEFGPRAPWGQAPTTSWSARIDLTSTQKATSYLSQWNSSIVKPSNTAVKTYSLGGYAYFWGIEPNQRYVCTHAWFSMFLTETWAGYPLGAIDTLQYAWKGTYPTNRAPEISSISSTAAQAKVAPSGQYLVTFNVTDPEGAALTYTYEVRPEIPNYTDWFGGVNSAPAVVQGAIVQKSGGKAIFKVPSTAGAYRFFAYARDGANKSAVADFPFYSDSSVPVPTAPAALPPESTTDTGTSSGNTSSGGASSSGNTSSENFYIYKDADDPLNHGYWTNWMLDGATINASTYNCAETPHSGSHCIKYDITYKDPWWGGMAVVSQANYWGDVEASPQSPPYNLTGAKKLIFWARGQDGGEKVQFTMGSLNGQKYGDSAKSPPKSGTLTLNKDWTKYELDVSGQDLSRIVNPFSWFGIGSASQVRQVFFLDDVYYEFSSSSTTGSSSGNTTGGTTGTTSGNSTGTSSGNSTGGTASGNSSGGSTTGASDGKFYVYKDSDDASNHGYWTNWMLDGATINASTYNCTESPQSGTHCIKYDISYKDPWWGGMAVVAAPNYWGDVPLPEGSAPYDLTGAKKLVFWARGQDGGEKVSFTMGSLNGQKYGDSAKTPPKSGTLTMNKAWTKYELDVSGQDLSRIVNPFSWFGYGSGNQVRQVFFLDEIYYEFAVSGNSTTGGSGTSSGNSASGGGTSSGNSGTGTSSGNSTGGTSSGNSSGGSTNTGGTSSGNSTGGTASGNSSGGSTTVGGSSSGNAGDGNFYIYKDAEDPLNHGFWTNWMLDGATINASTYNCAETPHSGSHCIKYDVTYKDPWWGGMAVVSQPNYWGDVPSAPENPAYNLTGAKKLVFWARGQDGGEKVSFTMASLNGQKYGDSAKTPPKSGNLTLNKAWTKYELDVSGQDLSRIVNPFSWFGIGSADQVRQVFYLDDVYYEYSSSSTSGSSSGNTTGGTTGNSGTGTSSGNSTGGSTSGASSGGSSSGNAGDGKFYVYKDSDDASNHGYWTNWMLDGATINASTYNCAETPQSGSHCIKYDITYKDPWWGGMAVVAQPNYWGDVPSAQENPAYDLTGAKKLVFWARGQDGGEKVSFTMGSLNGQKYGDSAKTPPKSGTLTLNKAWTKYELDMSGQDLSRIVNPFSWFGIGSADQVRQVFYLDEIYYEYPPVTTTTGGSSSGNSTSGTGTSSGNSSTGGSSSSSSGTSSGNTSSGTTTAGGTSSSGSGTTTSGSTSSSTSSGGTSGTSSGTGSTTTTTTTSSTTSSSSTVPPADLPVSTDGNRNGYPDAVEQYYLSHTPTGVMLPLELAPKPEGGVVTYSWPGVAGYTRALGNIKITYTPGSLREYMPVMSIVSSVPPGDPPTGYSTIGLVFELTGILADGQSVVIDLPLPDHLNLGVLSERNFLMQFYDPTSSKWKDYPTDLVLNRPVSTLGVRFTHFSIWRMAYNPSVASDAGSSSSSSTPVQEAGILPPDPLDIVSKGGGGGGCFIGGSH